MSKRKKLFDAAKSNPGGLRFSDFVRLIEALGFSFRRQTGSHQIYAHGDPSVPVLNIQESSGKAKRYQVEQLLAIVEQHKMEV